MTTGLRLVCVVDINYEKRFCGDVIGAKYEIPINGRCFEIYFPLEAVGGKIDFLIPPDFIRGFVRNGNEACFGKILDRPSKNFTVDKIVIATMVEDEVDAKDLAENISNNIGRYINRFLDYLLVLSGYIEKQPRVEENPSTEFLLLAKKNEKPIRVSSNASIYVYLDNMSPPSHDVVAASCKLLAENVAMPLEYEYYLSALSAYEVGENRKSILDLSTACEVSITKKIEKLLVEGKSSMSKKILEDYQGLYKRLRLLTMLDESYKCIDISCINKSRNKAIHSGATVEDDGVGKALKRAKEVLDLLSKFW